jgi:hypothetical protein
MKINRSGILSFKFAKYSKKEFLCNILFEYAKAVNYFINKFHNVDIKIVEVGAIEKSSYIIQGGSS